MFIKTLTDYLKEKANSTILISFAIFYVICNNRWIFASIFTDQNLIFEKYHLLKNEYIYQSFPELHLDNFLFWFCIIMPFILTYIYVWWVPRTIINPAFKRQTKDKNARRKIKIEEENKLSSLTNTYIKAESENTEAMIALEEKRKELNEKNPEKLLDEEYRLFQNNANWAVALSALRDIVYGNYGLVGSERNPEILMLLDVNDLVESSDMMSDQIELTEKGRAFLKRALEEKLL